jgi:hypothetical protein
MTTSERGIERLPMRGDRPPIDFHVHVGPELLARRYSAREIAEEAHAAGFGCILKNHFIPTTGLAAEARTHRPVTILGGVVLNYAVGGLNPHAVRAALSANKAGTRNRAPDPVRFMVWMPTIHSESHLEHNGRRDLVPSWGVDERLCQVFPPGTGITVWGPGGPGAGLAPAVHEVLDLVRAHDLILATGHLSAPEVRALVPAAHDRGIRRIVITHPFYGASNLSVREQAALAERDGVYLEHCYSNLEMDGIPIAHYVASIRDAGPRRVILSTDLGQPHNPTVTEGIRDFLRQLQAQGLSEDDLLTMLVDNPHRLIGPS